MEFIVQLFRALANRERIRIMRLLVVFREMRVTRIAYATGLKLTTVSGHLKVLAAAGLVWRRRSGRIVYYRLAEQAGNPVTGTALAVIQDTFAGVGGKRPEKVASADQAKSASKSDAALFACFTAFTHPRRLQIIRHLADEPKTTLKELAGRLSMSYSACHRHLEKLERRKFVNSARRQEHVTYALAKGDGKVQRRILKAMCDHFRGADR